MAPLRLAFATLALDVAAPCVAASVADWRPYVAEASVRFGVPVAWIERVISVESDGQTMLGGRPIRSRVGAMGVMQLMPGTWQMMRAALGLGPNPDDPHDNILAGTLYLRMMYDRFGYPGMFAGYNAGPTRFAARLATGRKLPSETVSYLRKISLTGSNDARPVHDRQRNGLFAVETPTARNTSAPLFQASQSTLFVVQNAAH